MKITIDGHGGHLCQASVEGFWKTGSTIDEAIGNLVRSYPEVFGIKDITILPCQTTAYDRSDYYLCPTCNTKLTVIPKEDTFPWEYEKFCSNKSCQENQNV
jgi:hypothetical protein